MAHHPLKLLPAYTRAYTIEQALADPHAQRLLWLEILVNDELDLTPWMEHPFVRDAYQKSLSLVYYLSQFSDRLCL